METVDAASAFGDLRDGGARRRSDSYYSSEYNAPPGYDASKAAGVEAAAPRWGLRGYVPPARLRVEGYAYANAEDSECGIITRERYVMRVIDERELAYDGPDDGTEAAMGVPTGEREATRRRQAGGMSSRPSWTATQYQGRCAA